ncbi:MAG TPA: hypothetical protein VME43_11335 [Bryobacteraceae bacterium]|nr:hypothetical protein [Bryobacteraceae bacterium]
MRVFTLALLAAAVGIGVTATAPKAQAQVGVEVGVAPDCPYGYYDVPPYACAPAGYYGPEWFVNGIFIGAGPWFHGPAHFHGYVNNHFHPAHGYKGPMPHRGEKPEAGKRVNASSFHGNEMRDGRGHVVKH